MAPTYVYVYIYIFIHSVKVFSGGLYNLHFFKNNHAHFVLTEREDVVGGYVNVWLEDGSSDVHNDVAVKVPRAATSLLKKSIPPRGGTPPKINMEPQNGDLKDFFPL